MLGKPFDCLLSRQVHGNLGSSVAQGSEVIEPEEWHHLVYRYDAQSKSIIKTESEKGLINSFSVLTITNRNEIIQRFVAILLVCFFTLLK